MSQVQFICALCPPPGHNWKLVCFLYIFKLHRRNNLIIFYTIVHIWLRPTHQCSIFHVRDTAFHKMSKITFLSYFFFWPLSIGALETKLFKMMRVQKFNSINSIAGVPSEVQHIMSRSRFLIVIACFLYKLACSLKCSKTEGCFSFKLKDNICDLGGFHSFTTGGASELCLHDAGGDYFTHQIWRPQTKP